LSVKSIPLTLVLLCLNDDVTLITSIKDLMFVYQSVFVLSTILLISFHTDMFSVFLASVTACAS